MPLSAQNCSKAQNVSFWTDLWDTDSDAPAPSVAGPVIEIIFQFYLYIIIYLAVKCRDFSLNYFL